MVVVLFRIVLPKSSVYYAILVLNYKYNKVITSITSGYLHFQLIYAEMKAQACCYNKNCW